MEEQYYLIWPALLIVGLRLRRSRLVGLLAAVVTVSLALRFIGPYDARGYERAYYLPHTNVWALLVGSALALLVAHKSYEAPARIGNGGHLGHIQVGSENGH